MSFIRLGITGPRDGISANQIDALTLALSIAKAGGAQEFHHGDCIGADVIGAQIARSMGYLIVCHPPTVPTYRAFFSSDVTHQSLPYLERDEALVDAVIAGDGGAMLGFPTLPERNRSGTWYTVRYARYRQAPLLCVAPTGLVIDHHKVSSIYPSAARSSVTTDLRTVNEESA